MKKLLYLFFCFLYSFHLSFADDLQNNNEMINEGKAKIVYVKIDDLKNDTSKTFYVGQTIPVTYNLLLFSNARFVGTDFVGGIDKTKLVLKNPNTKWTLLSDGSYQAIYYYKIVSTSAVIPSLKVSAVSSDGNYTDSSIAPPISLNIIDLYQNQKYAGVVGDSFDILGYKAKNYDNLNNILVFEVDSKNSNLEDLKIPEISKQGFESSNFGIEDSNGIYYVIVPKNMQNLNFEYFSLIDNHFKTIMIPIVPSDDIISTQDDIRPKNTFLIFSNIMIILLMVLCVVLFFIFKKRKIIFLIVFVLLFAYLLWGLFAKHQVVLYPSKPVRILPTYNSTILETSKKNTKVEVIGEHSDYYKIITPDNKIGWINKKDVK